MSWISGLVGGIGAGAEVRGHNAQVSKQNAFWQPGTINNYARQMNPWIWNAIQGNGLGQGGFQGDLTNIAQGKDISPWLLNQPLNQINRSADTNMARITSQLGRSNMSGGLANAYALSNTMGRQNATANLYQNYGQWREQQRRSDLNWILGQVQGSQQQGWDMAGKQQFKKNFWEKLGAFGQAFVGASGGGGMTSSQRKQKTGNYDNSAGFAGSPNYGQTTQYNPSWMNGQSFGTYGGGS